MSDPVWETTPSSELLSGVLSLGFTGFHRGGLQHFFELLGVGVSFQGRVCAAGDEGWMQRAAEVVRKAMFIYNGSTDSPDWAGLRSTVIAAIRKQQVPTAISAPCFTNFQVPDLADDYLLRYITAGLGVCLVWYEIVNNQPLTRCFHSSEDGQRLYFVYMGRERTNLFVFFHPGLFTADSAVASGLYSARWRPSLVLGEFEKPRGSYNPHLIARLFRTLVSVAEHTRTCDLKKNQKTELDHFARAWEEVRRSVMQTPLREVLNPDEVCAVFSRLSSSSASEETDQPQNGPHCLRDCMRYASYSADRVVHPCRGRPEHWFHRLCLTEDFEEKARTGQSMSNCPHCSLPFTQKFAEEQCPGLHSLRNQRVQEETYKKFHGSV